MKKINIIAILIFLSITACGQQYEKSVKEIKDQSSVKLLGSIETFFIKQADRFAMQFFVVSNGSGSANIPGGDEITENVLICVSEYDDDPVYRIFSVGPFYMPKFAANGTDLKDRYSILIEHGAADNRKRTKLIIYLDKVIVE